MNYGLAYAVGFHPWEDAESEQGFVAKFSELFDREEAGRTPPYGKALDLGCGSGIWGIRLAERGWQVTGVDNVPKALARAKERMSKSGVEMRLVDGDVTALSKSDVGSGYQLILDTGTFHGLTKDQRQAMGREVSSIAAPAATLFLLVWPARRRPLIRGAERADVEAAFPGWTITHVEPSGFVLPKVLEMVLRPNEHWYRLERG
jgi:cyclopropane fatty-acyl-phospholipid synthase-like methyltransferase